VYTLGKPKNQNSGLQAYFVKDTQVPKVGAICLELPDGLHFLEGVCGNQEFRSGRFVR
jgi:hypothetical protein